MIIRALNDYYERLLHDPDTPIAQPGFERKAIPFLLVIDKDGRFVNLRETQTGEGKKKEARAFLVPQGEKKASGIKANLLWDSAQYVLGLPKSEKEKDIQRAAKALEAFRKRIDETFSDGFQDEGIGALKKFLDRDNNDTIAAQCPELWQEIIDSQPNMSFVLETDNELIAQRTAVVQHLKAHSSAAQGSQICSVTGREDVPAKLHTAIKGVWGAQKAGANIVSFNLDAFCSLNKKQGANVPVGEKTVFAYTTALNHLLSKDSPQRMQVGDASTVFWAKESNALEEDFSFLLGEPSKGEENVSYDRIRDLLSAVKTGVLPKEDDCPFYVLGLAPNASRIAVRFWYDGTTREIKQRIAQHFEDIAIVRGTYDPEFLSLFRLLLATATESKADNIPPNLGGDTMRAILSGLPYPRTLLANAVRRCKAEQRIPFARAAIIKGVLNRDNRFNRTTTKEDITVSLDKDSTQIGYVLGRLFAVFERIQEKAQTGLNKTIRDTYFGAACSNPLVVFKRLQDLSIHHLAKIRNSGNNTVWYDKLMQEVMDKVPAEGIPKTLRLEEQGRFAVGYYHQRQDFFTKNETHNEEGEE
jgi:CRISPR-associated protein Csd1